MDFSSHLAFHVSFQRLPHLLDHLLPGTLPELFGAHLAETQAELGEARAQEGEVIGLLNFLHCGLQLEDEGLEMGDELPGVGQGGGGVVQGVQDAQESVHGRILEKGDKCW